MLFSSISFLYIFLPAVLIAYFLAPPRAKNAVLLAFSLLFYFVGEPRYTVLLLFSSVSDYLHSLYIEKHRTNGRGRAALISSIIINVGMLGFFKYADFFVESINALLSVSVPQPRIALPIGISFFTFQTMSYTIDVYRGKVHAQRNFATLATFVCLFPQLIAGPIVRYSDISEGLAERRTGLDDMAKGISRFVCGLGKKVLIANAMGELCAAFRASGDKSVLFCWIYAVAFTLQVYFDFSGYSDMAIGLGRMFGFHFPENFDYPYISRSLTEFWRRWHMTLGGWFRDYVYIPLGGSRVSKLKWVRNLSLVWLLTGLWHGAAWNFVLWGAVFGVMLPIEKLWLGKFLEKSGRVLPRVYVLTVVLFSFVVFNADGLNGAANDIGAMLGLTGLPLISSAALYYLRSYALLLIAAIIGSTHLPKRLAHRLGAGVRSVLAPSAQFVLIIAVTASLVDGSFNPFLYFRF